MTIGWVLGVIGAIIVLWIIWGIVNHTVIKPRRRRLRHEAWQLQERTEWLDKFATLNTDEKLAWMHKPDERWANAETAAAVEAINEAEVREEARILAERTGEATQFYAKLRLLTDVRERWALLKDAPEGPEYVDDGETSLNDYWKMGMKQYAKLLLDEVRSGNAASFFELSDLVFADQYDDNSYRYIVGKKFNVPKDWDELVTTFFKNPSVKQFCNQRDYAPNEILLVATEALRTHSFIAAKHVLAYSMVSDEHNSGYGSSRHSQRYWPYRDAIGELLLTELAAMVDSVHVTRGLFQHEVATTVVE
ncbi:MAG: hypothetical protein ABIP50_03410 [Candidatus Saccharimonadales bacterium]